jgi:hypothetical protein
MGKDSPMKIAVLPATASAPKSRARRCACWKRWPAGPELFEGDVGGAAYRRHGHPLPKKRWTCAREADAILFGAVGDPTCDALERHLRPEQAILGLRKELGLFANLRPAGCLPGWSTFPRCARSGRRDRPADRARAERRRLFRRQGQRVTDARASARAGT